jgi:hypothetical protein
MSNEDASRDLSLTAAHAETIAGGSSTRSVGLNSLKPRPGSGPAVALIPSSTVESPQLTGSDEVDIEC